MMYELKHFTNLVIRLDNPEIQTVDALLIRLVGDRVAGTMLKTLIYWMPKSVRADGNVYKSWRHWMAECVLSIAQIKRIHHKGILEQFGIERKLKKADGAPTNHYKVNFTDLLKKVADFLMVQVEQVKTWMLDDASPLKAPRKSKYKSEKSSAQIASEESLAVEEEPSASLRYNFAKPEPEIDNSPKLGYFTAKEGWKFVKSQLALMMDRGSYETFIKRTDYADFLPETHTLVIETQGAYECEMLSGRLFPRMQRSVLDFIGPEYNVQFVTRSTA